VVPLGYWSARLLRHGRRAYTCRAAGAYVSGAAGSNECPAGSVPIETAAACRTAAAAAGKTARSPFAETYATEPRGCVYCTASGDNAYFNAHAVGAGNFNYQLLCAAVTTGAPPPLPMRACADTVACVPALLMLTSLVHVRSCVCFRECVAMALRGKRTLQIAWLGSNGGALRYGHCR
jgi:hypothetical protein